MGTMETSIEHAQRMIETRKAVAAIIGTHDFIIEWNPQTLADEIKTGNGKVYSMAAIANQIAVQCK